MTMSNAASLVPVVSLVAAALSAQGAGAQDATRGKLLYDTQCGGCHYERVHDRMRTEIKDLTDLRGTVARWAPRTERSFTEEELEDVAQYLNESHYRIGLALARREKQDRR